MDDFSTISHKLNRDGYSQLDRTNQALSPAAVKVDGREMKDLLQFLYQYARQINYYEFTDEEDSNKRTGDWVPFFRGSVPFQYAVISSYDLDALDTRFDKVSSAINGRLTFESLNLLFDLLFDITDQITQWSISLREDNSGLKKGIESLIETNLRAQLLKLIKLTNSAGKWGYKRTKNSRDLGTYWKINPMDLYGVDRSILLLKGSLKHKVLDAFAILEELYRTFWKAVQTIVSIANDGEQLEKSLINDEQQNHQPHLGLLFAFLRLFQDAQGGLNQLSTAHLDFFYKKTLQLKNQPLVPDYAHLTFGLAKKIEEDILIEKGTRFKAGKDSNDQDIIFELDEELIVTKTKVADLRSLFIDREVLNTTKNKEEYQKDIRVVEGIYSTAIANSADGLGEAFPKGVEARWATVGAKKSKWIDPDGNTEDPIDHPFARLGFILASKVLFLREGERTITLTLTLDNAIGKPLPADLFKVFLTTEEGWLNVKDHITDFTLNAEDCDQTIVYTINLPPDFPPIVGVSDTALLEADYKHTLPMLKFELNQDPENSEAVNSIMANCYAALRQRIICAVNIAVTVCDVRQLILQNDLAIIDANKPFMPFGPLPKKNSANFYIGSEEIFCKRWDNIEINPVWKDKPDFATYYEAYDNAPSADSDFKANVTLLNDKSWLVGPGKEIDLFSNGTGAPISTCTNTDVYWAVNRTTDYADAAPCADLSEIKNGYLADTPCGFLRIKLGAQDFLHDKYANTLIKNIGNFGQWPELKEKIIALEELTDSAKGAANSSYAAALGINCDVGSTIATAKSRALETRDVVSQSEDDVDDIYQIINTIAPLPNVPYTPLIESISVNYTATANTAQTDEILFTHLHPFKGTYESLPVGNKPAEEVTPESGKYETTLLPCVIDEGTLFIGLEDYKPGSNLNLFFQMEPASADPDLDKAIVCWEFLRNNEWMPLLADIHILSDSTEGLIQSGILNFTIPSSISNEETTVMPSHLHWIKARVLYNTAAISETFTIYTQSAKATFVPETDNDLSRLSQPLEAARIAKFESPVAGIKGVDQFYKSVEGRPEEDADTFYHRTSEHLKHKGRAISIYDYERIILQNFEEIYKVKCISHTLGRRGKTSDFELAPGFVTIVVIPDLNKVQAVDPLQPKIPAATLNKVKELLKKKTSPFIKIEVLNPIFKQINVRANVKFIAGKSNVFYVEKLEEDVTAFLAPWAFSETRQDISFGAKVFYSTILKFIEDRDYVDFLIDFTMEDEDGNVSEIIQADGARGVLTSGAHSFTAIESGDQLTSINTSSKKGIGYTKIKEI